MITSTHYVIPKQWLKIAIAAVALLLVGATVVLSQSWVQPDGRINQVAHFGGDALYCVDRNMQATNQYSDSGEGGFRLLSMSGQELWFVPTEVIAAAVAEAKETGKSVLVATGNGTYGPTRIDAYTTGDGDDYFVFIGYDEYGKPNSVEWKFCIPVGPAPQPPPTASPVCTSFRFENNDFECLEAYCEAYAIEYGSYDLCFLCETGEGQCPG